jgi:hypothetical protein
MQYIKLKRNKLKEEDDYEKLAGRGFVFLDTRTSYQH